jgi:PAS domain S-box-containing protein
MEIEQKIGLKGVDLGWQSRMVVVACLMVVTSYAAALLGGTLEILPQAEWPLWPANVLVVCVLLLMPRRSWPLLLGTVLAAFAVYNLQAKVPIHSILLLCVADTVEILIAVFGLRYWFAGVPKLNSMKALAKYSFFGGILAPAAGAIFGAMSARNNYWTSWRISFLSEAIAFFTILPAILGWIDHAGEWRRAGRKNYVEAVTLLAAMVCLGYLVFVSHWGRNNPALFYFLVPFLLWSALRFGSAGAGTSASVVAFLSVWGAAHGRGPFTDIDPLHSVLWLQLFLLATAVPFMILATLVEERKHDEWVLRESEKRFRLVADTAPVLIWMSGTDKLCNFFNKGWLDFTGRSIEEERGVGWFSGVHPEDTQRCMEVYSSSFDARVAFEMEYRLRRYDGNYRWVVDYGVPRFETDGDFCGYIGSCVDVTERKSAAESLKGLSGRLIQAQEEERARIARELHDDFSQRLALLGVGLGQLWKVLPASDLEERGRVEVMLKGIKELSMDIHSLSHELHSSRLQHVGLVSALGGLCKEISKKYKIEVQFSEECLPVKIPSDVALCLFRVAQESLSNVIKHSEAQSAQVEVVVNESRVSLRIRDEGKGFNTSRGRAATGIGLVGMQERMRLVGGTLVVKSELRLGTEIVGEVPLVGMASEARV